MRLTLSDWGVVLSIASLAVIHAGFAVDVGLILLNRTPITHYAWKHPWLAWVVLLPFITAFVGMAIHLFISDVPR